MKTKLNYIDIYLIVVLLKLKEKNDTASIIKLCRLLPNSIRYKNKTYFIEFLDLRARYVYAGTQYKASRVLRKYEHIANWYWRCRDWSFYIDWVIILLINWIIPEWRVRSIIGSFLPWTYEDQEIEEEIEKVIKDYNLIFK